MSDKLIYLIVLITLTSIVIAEDNISGNISDVVLLNLTFNITNETITDNLSLEIPANQSSESHLFVCNESRCDKECAVCSDNKCHAPDFECREELKVEKVSPASISIGTAQLNVLLRNTGNVDLKDIIVEVSGYGISTLEKAPIETLAANDKDYSFVKVNAEKAGVTDIVIKLYINGTLKDSIVKQLTVLEENITEKPAEVNITMLSDELKLLEEKYREIEQDYQLKKLQGYPVDFIYDKLKEANDYIKESKFYLVEEGYKKAELDLSIIRDNLANIEKELKEAKKQEVKLGDKIKNNTIYIGSIAAAIVSMLTAYNLIKGHINKQKIRELQEKLKSKKKEEAEEAKESSAEEKKV